MDIKLIMIQLLSVDPLLSFPSKADIIWSTSLRQFNKPQNRRIFADLIVYIFLYNLAYMKQYAMNKWNITN